MRKRTNINVDVALLRLAERVLGTKGTTQTVHAAMEDVVRRDRLKRLAARDFSELTPATLEEMRSPRTAEHVSQPETAAH